MNKLLAILPIAIVAASIGAAQAQSPRLISETPANQNERQAQASTTTNLGTHTGINTEVDTKSPSLPTQGNMGLDTRNQSQSAQNQYPNLIRRSPVPNTGNQCFVDTTLDPITHKEVTTQIGVNCKPSV